MKKSVIKLITIIILVMLLLISCNYKKEEGLSNSVDYNDELVSKYDEMQSKYKMLLSEIDDLNNQFQILQSDVDTNALIILSLEKDLENIKSELGYQKEIIIELKEDIDKDNMSITFENVTF